MTVSILLSPPHCIVSVSTGIYFWFLKQPFHNVKVAIPRCHLNGPVALIAGIYTVVSQQSLHHLKMSIGGSKTNCIVSFSTRIYTPILKKSLYKEVLAKF
jgi:hypothetical protein